MTDNVKQKEEAVRLAENAVHITAIEVAQLGPMPTYDTKGVRVDPAYC